MKASREFVKQYYPRAICKRMRSNRRKSSHIYNFTTLIGYGTDAAAAWKNAESKIKEALSKTK